MLHLTLLGIEQIFGGPLQAVHGFSISTYIRLIIN